jgi:Sensors of blue-light using FAD
LTGLLLYQGDSFYGVLEGPQTRVFQRMEVIICDRRHARVEILREDTIEKRRFDNWSFGVLPESARSKGLSRPDAFIRSLATRLG